MPDQDTAADKGFLKMGLESSNRHVFLCVGPDCCTMPDGLQTWEYLKERMKALGIPAMRTKAACLRICTGGPWMVIYPEGVWYGRVTPERCAHIIDEHLLNNTVVAEWVAREHPLDGGERA